MVIGHLSSVLGKSVFGAPFISVSKPRTKDKGRMTKDL